MKDLLRCSMQRGCQGGHGGQLTTTMLPTPSAAVSGMVTVVEKRPLLLATGEGKFVRTPAESTNPTEIRVPAWNPCPLTATLIPGGPEVD